MCVSADYWLVHQLLRSIIHTVANWQSREVFFPTVYVVIRELR